MNVGYAGLKFTYTKDCICERNEQLRYHSFIAEFVKSAACVCLTYCIRTDVSLITRYELLWLDIITKVATSCQVPYSLSTYPSSPYHPLQRSYFLYIECVAIMLCTAQPPNLVYEPGDEKGWSSFERVWLQYGLQSFSEFEPTHKEQQHFHLTLMIV